MGALSQQSSRLLGAATASVLVMLGVAVPILVSQFLPSADGFGAGMPEGMVDTVISTNGMVTVGLAVVVGLLWYAFNGSALGRTATIVIAVLGVTFLLYVSWGNCLIPHEYCSAMR